MKRHASFSMTSKRIGYRRVNEKIVDLSVAALEAFASRIDVLELEEVRIARAAFALSQASGGKHSLCRRVADALSVSAHSDGGWSDPEETAWVTCLLSTHLGPQAIKNPIKWLNSTRDKGGGWSRHLRDRVRIITTALVINLVPKVAAEADWDWLRNEWSRDFERPIKLSYKGGFYLLAEKTNVGFSLPDVTIRFLENDQNDDGGFGPWKNHPIGSDPWSTGVVLWGLSRWIDRVDKKVVERALDWLEKTQLPSGYWPYHYLDEGTSYALIGAVSALKALQRL